MRHPPVDDRLGRLAERRTGHVARVARVLHASMLRAILLPSMHFFDTTPVGRIVARFTGDVTQIEADKTAAAETQATQATVANEEEIVSI